MLKKSKFISALVIVFALVSCNNDSDSKDAKKDSIPVVKMDSPAVMAPAKKDSIMDSSAKRTGKPVHNP